MLSLIFWDREANKQRWDELAKLIMSSDVFIVLDKDTFEVQNCRYWVESGKPRPIEELHTFLQKVIEFESNLKAPPENELL